MAYAEVEVLGITMQAFEAFLGARPTTAVKILRSMVSILATRLRQSNVSYSSLKRIADDMA